MKPWEYALICSATLVMAVVMDALGFGTEAGLEITEWRPLE